MIIDRRLTAAAAAACTLLAAGCSKSDKPTPPPPAEAARPAVRPSSKVVGTAPRPASDIPVIIVLDPKTARDWPADADRPVMDQVSLTFTPPLLFVRAGQPSEFRNSDDTLHNVHVTHEETREPQFNVAIPTGEVYAHTFKRDGFYHVGCDIHPAMAAEIFASASPYVATARQDGTFELDDVTPGAYSMIVYANGKRTEQDVTVTSGTTSVNVE